MNNIYAICLGLSLLLLFSGVENSQVNNVPSDHLVTIRDNQQRDYLDIKKNNSKLTIENLTPGDLYLVHFSNGFTDAKVSAEIENKWITLISSNQKTFQFIPKFSRVHFDLKIGFPDFSKSPPIYVSTSNVSFKRKKQKPTNTSQKSPPDIITSYTVEELVTDVFVQAACFDVENIQFTGAANDVGIAYFENALTFEFKQGVIMGNFNVTQVVGPNSGTGTGGGIGGTTNDPDLQALAGGIPINDGQELEFDFVPTVDQISFNYVWGSEEYCDYVDVAFNDVFGFFISGPGINGPYSNNSENIAVIPGSNTPVSINEVNWNDNSSYYITNDIFGGGTCTAGEIAADPAAPDDIELDGWTVKLTAVADVIPCETYHIKLAIGDGQDAIFGSAVFLEANSFFTGDAIDFDVVYSSPDADFVYENCNNDEACIVFTRPDEIPDTVDVYIPITEDGTSMAIEGVDYQFLPDTIVFPAGEIEVQFCLEVIDDDIIEGIEAAIFQIEGICACDDPLIEININDVPPLVPAINAPTEVCENEQFTVSVNINNDAPPTVTYSWSNGETGTSFTDQITETTTYSITVSDGCNQEEILERTVEVIPRPSATLSGEGLLCASNINCTELMIEFTGTGPWDAVYTYNGQNNFLNNINVNPYTLVVCNPGEYELTSVDAFGCSGDADGLVDVGETDIILDIVGEDALCNGEPSGSIDLTITDGVSPFDFQWDPILPNVEDPQDVPAGTYFVTVTDANGCSQFTLVTINQPTPVFIGTITPTPVGCLGPNSGAIDISVAGGTGNYSFDWSDPAEDIEDPQNLGVGAYQVTVTDENGCEVISDFVLISLDNNTPVAYLGPDTSITCNNPIIMIDGFADVPVGDPLIEWTTDDGNIVSGETTSMPLVDAPGTYTMTVSNPDGTCPSFDIIEIFDNTLAPVVDAGPELVLNCNTGSIDLQGSADPTTTVSWSTPDGNIIARSDTLNPEVDMPGTYIITALSQVNGCVNSDEVFVSIDTVAPIAAIASPDVITCQTTEVEVAGTGSSSGPEFEYEWTTQDGNIVSNTNNLDIQVNAPGSYNLLVRNLNNGCEETQSMTVEEDVDTLTIDLATPEILNCERTEIILDASLSEQNANSVISWNTSVGGNIVSGADTDLPTVDSPGTYTMTLMDTLTGCISNQTVVVSNDLTEPVVDAGNADILTCFVTEITLNGGSNFPDTDVEYLWSTPNGSITSGNNTANPLVSIAGTYILTMRYLPTGCTSLDSVIVIADENIPQIEVVNTQPIITCNETELNLDIDLSGNISQFDIQWTPGASGNILSGGNSENPLVDQPGVYTVTVVDTILGCVTSASVEVMINTIEPDANAGLPDSLTCNDTSLNLDASLSSSGNQFIYQWSTSNGNIVSGADQMNPMIDLPGTYTLVVTDLNNGCTSSDEVIIDLFDDLPTATAESNDLLTCLINNVVLNASMSIGNGPLAFDWSTNDGNIVSGSDIEFPVVNEPGTYDLVVTNTINGCTAETSVVVDQNIIAPVSDILTPAILTCNTASVMIDGSTSSNGTDYTYTWSTTGGNIISSVSSNMIEVNAPGTYTLEVTDGRNGCRSEASIVVSENVTLPDAVIEQPEILTCNIESTILDGTNSSSGSNFSYAWYDSGVTIGTSNTQEISSPGVYLLEVIDNDNGCRTTTTIEVFEDRTDPEAEFNALSPGCEDITGSINLSNIVGTPPFNVSIDGGNSFNQNLDFSNLDPGIYDVILRDGTGCAISRELEIIENIPLESFLNTNAVVIPFGENHQIDLTVNLDPSEIVSITWSPEEDLSCSECEDPVASPLQSTEYFVTIVSNKGCITQDQVLIRVDDTPNIYVPTVFSPNGDNTNDVFTIFAKANQVNTIQEFRIYDRWGNLMFENYDFQPGDLQNGWDGVYYGEVLKPGVFVFYALLKLTNGNDYKVSGDITLLK